MEPSLTALLTRSAQLKRALVDFAGSPRCSRSLGEFLAEAGYLGNELAEDESIDRFAL
jgi:hypothetical protein